MAVSLVLSVFSIVWTLKYLMSGCAGAGQPWEEEECGQLGPAARQLRGVRMDRWRGSKRHIARKGQSLFCYRANSIRPPDFVPSTLLPECSFVCPSVCPVVSPPSGRFSAAAGGDKGWRAGLLLLAGRGNTVTQPPGWEHQPR